MASRYSASGSAVKETASVDSGVGAHPGLVARPQPAAGLSSSGDRDQRSSSSPSPPSSVQTPTFRVSSYYPDPSVAAMLQPQAWQWYYYDPTRLHLSSPSQLPSPSIAMTGPPLPSVSNLNTSGITSPVTPNTIHPIDATLQPIDVSLKALHSKFTTIQKDLGGLQSDVKDALSQIQSLRTAQNKTNKSITDLHDVVGLSATRVQPRGRGRGGRGRAKGSNAAIVPENPPEIEDVRVDTIPEKTLAQSMASIQSAIEALLSASHSHIPAVHREARPPPAVNHLPVQESLQTHDSSPAPPEKGYADASTQTRIPSPSERSYSPSSSHEFVPGLIPVDWSVDSVRPAVQSAGSLHNVSRSPGASHAVTDTQTMPQLLCNLGASGNHSSTRPTSSPTLSSLQGESVATNTTRQVHSTAFPTASGTSDTSAKVPVCPFVTESSSRVLEQSPLRRIPFLTTAGVESSNKSSQMNPSVGPQVLLRSPSSPLSSACDTLMDMGCPGRTDGPVTSDTEGDTASVLKMAAELTCIASGHPHHSPPIAAVADEGLTSGLPTSPSETVLDERDPRLANRTAHGDIVTIGLGRLPGNSMPPSLTTDPSMGQDRGEVFSKGDGCSLGEVSELPSLLTPSLLSRSSVAVCSSVEKGARQTATHEETESPDDATVVDPNDAIKRLSATEGADSGSTFAMLVTTRTSESRSMATSHGKPSQTPQVANDDDPYRVPESSTSPNVASPRGDVSVDPAFSLSIDDTGYDFHFPSPLRRPSPPMSPTPSRYATPSEPSDSHLMQDHDEDEVWHTLMLNESGVSTPLSDSTSLPMRFSHQPSRASSVHPHPLSLQPLSVDPSVLQLHPPECGVANSHLASDRSLSSLSSLSDAEVEDKGNDDDVVQTRKTPPVRVLPVTAKPREGSRSRRSEPHRTHSHVSSNTPGECLTTSHTASDGIVGTGHSLMAHAGSARPVGGRGASVEELTLLARRQPLKICLKVPEGYKGLKRKRDDDMYGEGEAVDIVNEDVDKGHGRLVNEDAKVGRTDGASPGVPSPSRIGTTSKPVTHTPTPIASRLSLDRESLTGQLRARDDVKYQDTPVPRKRKKSQIERDGKIHAIRKVSDIPEDSHVAAMTLTPGILVPQLAPTCSTNSTVGDGADDHFMETANSSTPRKNTKKEGRRRQKNHQQVPGVNPKSPVKYHVRNGQIVAPGLESPTQVYAISSTSVVEVNQDVRTPMRTRQTKQENHVANMETSLENPSQPSLRNARLGPLSPVKDGDAIEPHHGTWPELPKVFSNWDVQFIQCDNCDKWYHYGCVLIELGDPRLEPGILFICPTCCNQSARRQTLRHQGDTCARPDCVVPKVTPDADIFVIEKLVGRKKCEGYIYLWLAKWEGYPISQATWIPKENVVGDSTRMINAFLKDAIEEGMNLSQDIMLLQEAIEGGWEA